MIANGADLSEKVAGTPLIMKLAKLDSPLNFSRYMDEIAQNPNQGPETLREWCTASDAKGNNVTHLEAERGNNFAKHGVHLSAENNNGDTPAHKAAANNRGDVVHTLGANNVPLDAQNKDGDTPIHLAVRHQHDETTKYLASHASAIGTLNHPNQKGDIPLVEAARSGYTAGVVTILRHDDIADPRDAVDAKGNSVDQVAGGAGFPKIADVIRNKCLDMDRNDRFTIKKGTEPETAELKGDGKLTAQEQKAVLAAGREQEMIKPFEFIDELPDLDDAPMNEKALINAAKNLESPSKQKSSVSPLKAALGDDAAAPQAIAPVTPQIDVSSWRQRRQASMDMGQTPVPPKVEAPKQPRVGM